MTMRYILSRLFRGSEGTAAIETAIVAPLFLILTLGVTDLGTGTFVRMSINAAAQAGATYAVVNSSGSCASLTSSCLSGIKTAMNQAIGNTSFCTPTGHCIATIAVCSDGSPQCVTVTASTSLSPLLPNALYSWATVTGITSTVTVRVA